MVAVSVIIPVFNGATVVGGALESVFAQTYRDFEVIVVDDGSTDDTRAAVAAFGDRLRLLTQANWGPSAARNAGARIAQGRYLAFLDADDRWERRMLAATVPILDREPATVLVFTDAQPVDECGKPRAESYVGRLGYAPAMADLLSRYWPILPSAAVVRGAAFARCGGFAEELRTYEDSLLWLKLREQGAFAYVAERLVAYRAEPAAARMGRYLEHQQRFLTLVRERYGDAARRLDRTTREAYPAALSHEGLIALGRGDRAAARRWFVAAWRARPTRLRYGARLLRTFLPLRLAQRLSGAAVTRAAKRGDGAPPADAAMLVTAGDLRHDQRHS